MKRDNIGGETMKYFVLSLVLLSNMMLPNAVYSYCDTCQHWHIDKNCVVDGCDCNVQPEIDTNSIKWPSD